MSERVSEERSVRRDRILFLISACVLCAAVLFLVFCIPGDSVFRSGQAGSGDAGSGAEAGAGEESGTGADAEDPAQGGGTASAHQADGTEGTGEAGEEKHDLITDTVYKPIRRADSFEGIIPDRFGDAGLLLIPSAGVNVRLFKGSDYSGRYNQQGVDMEDSAGLINWGGEDIIADHENQGFTAISSCVPGETRAYIVQEDHAYLEYLCEAVMDGTNDEYHLTGSDGHDYMNEPSDQCDLVMYTCLENWQHICIVLWKEV